MKIKSFILTFLLCGLVNAQLIPPSRLSTWQGNVGVPGGIPTRTTIWKNIVTDLGADPTDTIDCSAILQGAINTCPANQVVYIPAGTFRLDHTINSVYGNSITIRGAGTASTTLDCRAGIGFNIQGVFAFDSNSDVTSGATAGSTSVVVSDPTGGGTPFTPGNMARLTWPNDPNKVWNVGGGERERFFDCMITGVSGSTITFSPPIPGDFGSTAPVKITESGYPTANLVGLEDFSLIGNGTSMIVGVQWSAVSRSWISNVKVSNHQGYGFLLQDSVLCEVKKDRIETGGSGTSHAGINIYSLSGCYIYDNIFVQNNPSSEENLCTSGNVFGYNLIIAGSAGVALDINHAPHQSFNLYEGNVTDSIQGDSYFGGTSEETFYRNWITGILNGDPFFVMVLKRFTRDCNFVGNICQSPGITFASDGVALDGFPNPGNGNSYGNCQPSMGIWWRDILPDGTTPYWGTISSRVENDHATDGHCNNSTAFSSATITFNSADVNTTFINGPHIPGGTYVVSVTDAHNVVLSQSTTGGNITNESFTLIDYGQGNQRGQHGEITLTSGDVGNMFGLARNDQAFTYWTVPRAPQSHRAFFDSHVGNVIACNGAPYEDILPPVGTNVEIWAGPGGFQELDGDVRASIIRRGNYYYYTGNIPAGEAIGGDPFPDSLYLTSRPAWFYGLAWPPFDPRSPGTPSIEQIPAGYRYVHGTDPPAGTPSPTPTASPSPTATSTPTATPTASPSTTPTATRTPAPTATRTPTPSPTRTPTPAPSPTRTPTPTPSASPICVVPSFMGKRMNQAQSTWQASGFNTLVNQQGVCDHKIIFQSIPPGSHADCNTAQITIRTN